MTRPLCTDCQCVEAPAPETQIQYSMDQGQTWNKYGVSFDLTQAEYTRFKRGPAMTA